MDIITIDFESFFSKDYSLSKMSTEEYIRDPRFEVHGVALLDASTGGKCWVPGPSVDLSSLRDSAVLCHHAAFDGLILSHHYNVRPAAWLDTLSMSRLLLGNHVGHSLDDLRAHFGMQAKTTPYKAFMGKRWGELDAPTQQAVAAGALDEVESIYAIFCRFMKGDY